MSYLDVWMTEGKAMGLPGRGFPLICHSPEHLEKNPE
jgi:hypothetical protein